MVKLTPAKVGGLSGRRSKVSAASAKRAWQALYTYHISDQGGAGGS